MKGLSLLYAFLGGALVGASAAILFAPEKGSDTASDTSKKTGAGSSTTTSKGTSTNTSTSTTPAISQVKNTSSPSISQKQKQLVDAANWAKGRNYLTINGHRFKNDPGDGKRIY